jgi:hypothetical protein
MRWMQSLRKFRGAMPFEYGKGAFLRIALPEVYAAFVELF